MLWPAPGRARRVAGAFRDLVHTQTPSDTAAHCAFLPCYACTAAGQAGSTCETCSGQHLHAQEGSQVRAVLMSCSHAARVRSGVSVVECFVMPAQQQVRQAAPTRPALASCAHHTVACPPQVCTASSRLLHVLAGSRPAGRQTPSSCQQPSRARQSRRSRTFWALPSAPSMMRDMCLLSMQPLSSNSRAPLSSTRPRLHSSSSSSLGMACSRQLMQQSVAGRAERSL